MLREGLLPARTLHGRDSDSKKYLGLEKKALYNVRTLSLLQQPGPKKFKLSKTELIYKAKKFKVPPFTI